MPPTPHMASQPSSLAARADPRSVAAEMAWPGSVTGKRHHHSSPMRSSVQAAHARGGKVDASNPAACRRARARRGRAHRQCWHGMGITPSPSSSAADWSGEFLEEQRSTRAAADASQHVVEEPGLGVARQAVRDDAFDGRDGAEEHEGGRGRPWS